MLKSLRGHLDVKKGKARNLYAREEFEWERIYIYTKRRENKLPITMYTRTHLKRPISYKHFTLHEILSMSFTSCWVWTIITSNRDIRLWYIICRWKVLEVYFPMPPILQHSELYTKNYDKNSKRVSKRTREVIVFQSICSLSYGDVALSKIKKPSLARVGVIYLIICSSKVIIVKVAHTIR